MNNTSRFVSILFSLIAAGCAWQADLDAVKRDLARQTEVQEKKVQATDARITELQAQTGQLETQTKSLARAAAGIRQAEANEGADITDTRDVQADLRGRLEVLQKDVADIKQAMDKVNARVSFAERYLDIGEQSSKMAAPEVVPGQKADVQGREDSDTAYAMAFNTFKGEKYAQARTEFESFLRRYPDSRKAASASYWIAESFYFEGNLKQAILQYDKVVKNYPASDKVPRALLKQGICFEKLNDKVTAKLLFEQIVRNYPEALESGDARKKIKEME